MSVRRWRCCGEWRAGNLHSIINPGAARSAPVDLCYPGMTASIGDLLLFPADDGVHGTELWKSDGSAAGTVLLKDGYPGPASSSPRELTSVGHIVFFCALDADHGSELWSSDGSPGGTRLVDDIRPGPQGSQPRSLTAAADLLFFVANDGTHGFALWRSTGTGPGTEMVAGVAPTSSGLMAHGGAIFFNVYGDHPALAERRH